MQQILLEEQEYFAELSGNSPGRPASSDSSFSQFQAPSTPVMTGESADETASVQNGTDTATLMLQSDQFFYIISI